MFAVVRIACPAHLMRAPLDRACQRCWTRHGRAMSSLRTGAFGLSPSALAEVTVLDYHCFPENPKLERPGRHGQEQRSLRLAFHAQGRTGQSPRSAPRSGEPSSRAAAAPHKHVKASSRCIRRELKSHSRTHSCISCTPTASRPPLQGSMVQQQHTAKHHHEVKRQTIARHATATAAKPTAKQLRIAERIHRVNAEARAIEGSVRRVSRLPNRNGRCRKRTAWC